MKSRLVILGGLLLMALFASPQNIPTFNPQPFKLYIPAFLPGIMEDASAELRNDTMIYSLEGQVFKGGYKIAATSAPLPLINPWQTLYAMTDAYAKRNKQKIIDLYSPDSKAKIQNVVNGPNAAKFFEVVSKAAPKLELLAGVNYQNGFAVYTQDDEYGLHENYMKKVGDAYRLSALSDKSPTGWNLALYFKFDPKPLLPVSNVSMPDSIKYDDSTTIRLTVPVAGRWVGVSLGQPGLLIMMAQDNGMNDFDPSPGRVAIHVKGNMFFNPGTYEFYIYSLNFPVQRVSMNFIKPELKYSIKIAE